MRLLKQSVLLFKKKVVPNYSTVTDFVGTIKFNPKNSIDNNVESILLKFELDIRTSKLTKASHCNNY